MEFSDLPVITSDRMKLKQILTNLINNAIKFTDHGRVTISAQMINLERTLRIQVADTGSGIPDDCFRCLRQIRQIDSTTTAIIRARGWVFTLLRPSSSC
jgi:signal transduction histidine kinase